MPGPQVLLLTVARSTALSPSGRFDHASETRSCQNCKLADADLVHAELQDADLKEADLRRANLSGARLDGADLRT